MLSNKEFDLLEQIIDEQDLSAAEESLNAGVTIDDFWASKDNYKLGDSVTEVGPERDDDDKSPEIITNSYNYFTTDYLYFLTEWIWCDKKVVIDELFKLNSTNTICFNVGPASEMALRLYVEVIGVLNIIKTIGCKIHVTVPMFLTPIALPLIAIADKVTYGEYAVAKLGCMFDSNVNIAPKYKDCNDEMMRLLRDIIINKGIMTNLEYEELAAHPMSYDKFIRLNQLNGE